jgi:hypothetical protein
MITKSEHPSAWALLCYDLDDAREHIEKLVTAMSEDPAFGEIEYRIGMAHVFAHLNRAWNARNVTGDLSKSQLNTLSGFPSDLEPTP